MGVLAGAVAVGFKWLLSESERSRSELLEWLRALPHAEYWAWSVLPMIGLIVGSAFGWVVLRASPDARGSGIPHLKGVLLHVRTMRWRSLLPVKFFVGALGVGAGLSLGREVNRALLGASAATLRARRVPRWVLPGLATGLCGLVAWWLPEAVGGGHMTAERLLTGHLAWGIGLLTILLLAKFVLTLASYASGAPGGIFAPMLLLGAICGAVVGHGLALVFPSIQPHLTALSILGMAAFFTGSVRAPLTGIVLIIEMTGNYQQLLALGVACLFADLTAGALRDRPIYEALLEAEMRRESPHHGGAVHVPSPRAIYIGVQLGSALAGQAVRASGLPPGCLVVGVERAGREILPEAGLMLQPGDHLSILVPDGEPEKAAQIVRLATGL